MASKRGRGRPRKNPYPEGEQPVYQVKTLSFPVTEKDENEVDCSLCQRRSTFREFRIHNLTTHYNLATTTDDPVTKDYRFFTRQLTEMGKLMKITTFNCPSKNCTSKYKSALGLGYHLEVCGKTTEEIQASQILCEICDKSFSSANIAWHRKTHEAKVVKESPKPEETLTKRTSAIKAKKIFKKLAGPGVGDATTDGPGSSEKEDDEFILGDDHHDEDAPAAKPEGPQYIPSTHEDISFHAYKALTDSSNFMDVWDRQVHFTENIFSGYPVNPCKELLDEAQLYLPDFVNSFTFRTKIRIPVESPSSNFQFAAGDFHKLEIFESEIADSVYGNNVINAGGPISALSWHPSGKYLAVATLKNHQELPQVHNLEASRTIIQIYENLFDPDPIDSVSGLSLRLALAVKNGYIHHLEWSNFSNNEQVPNNQEEDFLGHLAYACGDSNIEIIFLKRPYLQFEPNFKASDDSEMTIPFYTKVPEIRLRVHEAVDANIGQCVSFNWSEKFKYLAAGYGNGLIAVFDLLQSSKILKKGYVDDGDNQTIEIFPFWVIRSHTDVISAIFFNPTNPRFLVSASYDYFIRTWDIEFRREIESKRVGMVVDACWIRGWIHGAFSIEYINTTFQVGLFNAVKFYQVGNSKGYPGCSDNFNITSLSFFEGMVAQASEIGNVTVSFFDQFLRECDYDRNKKKKNTVDLSFVHVDKNLNMETGEEEPKIVFTFFNNRRESVQSFQEPNQIEAENYNVHYNLVRVNKVGWCPTGKQLAVGYHNGLLTVTPASFSTLYPNYNVFQYHVEPTEK